MDVARYGVAFDGTAATRGADQFAASLDKVGASGDAATAKLKVQDAALRRVAESSQAVGDTQRKVYEDVIRANGGWERYGQIQKQIEQEMVQADAVANAHAATLLKIESGSNVAGAGLGRLRQGFVSLVASLTGTSPILDRTISTLATLGVGTVVTLGVTAGLAAIAYGYDKVTEGARKAKAETDKLIESLEKERQLKELGPAGPIEQVIAGLDARIADNKKAASVVQSTQVGLNPIGSLFTKGGIFGPSINGTPAEAADLKYATEQKKQILADWLASQRSEQASELANLISHGHATAQQRANALDALRSWSTDMARLGPGQLSERSALSSDVSTLQEALFPKKDANRLSAAEDKLAGIRDKIKAMHDEAGTFGKDASVDNRVRSITDELDRMEKKTPALTTQIEALKVSLQGAGEEMKNAQDAETLRKQTDAAVSRTYSMKEQADAFRLETDALRQGESTRDRYLIDKRAQIELSKAQSIEDVNARTARIAEIEDLRSAEIAHLDVVKSIQAQQSEEKKAESDTAHRVKQMNDEIQRDFATLFENIFIKGIKGFGDFFGSIKDMFLKMLSEVAAADIMGKIGKSGMLFGLLGSLAPTLLGAQPWGDSPGTIGGTGPLKDLAMPYIQPHANPALAQAGAGIAGFGAGYAAGGMAGDGTSGALFGAGAGALTGAAVAGPVGAVIGGLAGFAGGLFAGIDAARAHAKALKDAATQFGISIDQFRAHVGGSNSDAAAADQVAQEKRNVEQIKLQAQAAHPDMDSWWKKASGEAEEYQKLVAELNAGLSELTASIVQHAKEQKQYAMEDLDVRKLRAEGNTKGADALALQHQQERELQAAIDAKMSDEYIARLKEVLAIEKTAAALDTLTTSMQNAPSGFKINPYINEFAAGRDMPTLQPYSGAQMNSTSFKPAAAVQIDNATFAIQGKNGAELLADLMRVMRGLTDSTLGINGKISDAMDLFPTSA